MSTAHLSSFCLLALVCVTCNGINDRLEFQRFDGWYNNLAHPQWGSVGSRLYRKVPSAYLDGVYMMDEERPSARTISDLVFRGADGLPNERNMTTMLAFFSQVVAYEVLQATETSCPLEMHKIAVPACDPTFDAACDGATMMPFTRANYDKETGQGFNSPREQVNARTSWIDASFLYSTQEPWVAAMRSFENGSLRQGNMSDYPPLNSDRIPLINPPPPQIHRLMDPERLFLLGDPRVNENPGLLAFGLILFRWHNRLAASLQLKHPQWSDDDIFHAARHWVIATLQNVIMYEFLPALLNDAEPLPEYSGYAADLPPAVSHVFAAAAFRFPHTLVPSGMFLRRGSEQCAFRADVGGFGAVRLCQNWWNAQDIVQSYSVDDVILGMASQLAEREDAVIVSDLRDYLFGPMHFTRLDLAAIGIMRGRDNGLPSYNAVRATLGLAAKQWHTINEQLFAEKPHMFANLSKLYNGDMDKLDVYVGGMLEMGARGPGELFTAIVKDQFLRIRDADRFWFENRQNGIFSDEEIAEIRNTSLRDIILATTAIQADQLQENVFFWKDGDPCPQPFQLSPSRLEPCVPFMRFDHFMGNEVAFLFTCIGLCIIPIVCFGVGYFMTRKRKLRALGYTASQTGSKATAASRRSFGNNNNDLATVFSVDKQANKRFRTHAIEWLHENYCRTVTVVVDRQQQLVSIEKPRGGLLRQIDLSCESTLTVLSTDTELRDRRPFVCLVFPRDYDLVLRLESRSAANKLLFHLRTLLKDNGKNMNLREVADDLLLDLAETRERRQRKLSHFFRESYAKAFDEPSMCDADAAPLDVPGGVLSTRLTRAEFAEALGMREEDLFIQRMFACVARDDRNSISFEEFLATVGAFAKGDVGDQLRLLFDMCDCEGDGLVPMNDFCRFMRSLKLAAGVQINDELQNELVLSVLTRAGVSRQATHLTRADFTAVFNEVVESGRPLGLHLRGTMQHVSVGGENESLHSFAIKNDNWQCWRSSWPSKVVSFLEDYRQHVTCLLLFYLIMAYFFVERFCYYRWQNEHRDLRRVMGAGIAITRGSAAAMSFCFGVILLTVCRNVITRLRETPLNGYIPFDAAISFHKLVAITCAVFAAIHSGGHCINFYHVATQSHDGLQCLFQEAVFSSNFQPSISYWLFMTPTGITGILLVIVMSIIYVFAAPSIINSAYHAFRLTHFLNLLLYALCIGHGLPKLLDSPKFCYFIAVPTVIFVIDRLLGLRQDYRQLQIISASLLPSDVIYLEVKRPRNFRFRSGQWVRVSCPAFSCHFNERHAFSLASAPQQPTLDLYLKAVGPWTWKLHHEIRQSLQTSAAFPVLHMDGPYGDGNQEWSNYEVAVLIGGGIGVTPYAAVLSDLVRSTSGGAHSDVACKKVYFLWVCPTHKNFEWFVDVLRQVERQDERQILDMHIFVTQFFHKFDLRTTVLYICEKHFRLDHGRSMFTNLRAVNHFGRPDFNKFLNFVQHKHADSRQIGVFSCGPAPLNKTIRNACVEANRDRHKPHFVHRFETF